MNTNYNLIKKILGDFASGHNQLTKAYLSFSDQRSYLLEQDKRFPCLYGVINNFNLDQNAYVINWSLRVYFMDIVLDGRENEDSVMNNTGEIALDFVKYLKKYEDDVELLNNSNATPLNNFDNNKFNGWYIDVVLSTKADQCAIPGDFPEVFRPETLCDYIGISSAEEIVDCLESDPAKYAAVVSSGLNPINDETITKSGQTTTYHVGDDGDFQFGNGSDYYTLNYNNPFGNLNRFTDTLGGQDYTNLIILDWSSWFPLAGRKVRAYYKLTTTNNLNYLLASEWDVTLKGYPNWRVCNLRQLQAIVNVQRPNGNTVLNHHPFNITTAQLGNGTDIGTTTRVLNTTTRFNLVAANGTWNAVAVGNSRKGIQTRLFDLSDLGL